MFACSFREGGRLPETLGREGTDGTGFEIGLEGLCLLAGGEREVGNQLPGFELRGVGGGRLRCAF